MDVAWQDSGVGSFLDSSGTDASSFASFGNSDGSVLWSSSGDSPVFSAQPVLWESSADAPADSHISGLILDSSSGTDTDTLSLGAWNADSAAGLAGSPLQGGLLWAGAGSETSSTLTNGTGVGLGALDLGVAGDTSSQWQQFVDQFAGGSATGLADATHLLWTGASVQPPITIAGASGLQPVQLAPSDSLPLPAVGSISSSQLMWTPPSSATGLTAGPSLADAAPTPPISGAGIVGSSSSNTLPLTGAGIVSHS